MNRNNGTHAAATIALTVAFIFVTIGGYLNANSEAGDPNIGAALLFLLGVGVGVVGIVLAIVAMVVKAARRRQLT
jgi:hypothetical protein